MLASNVNIKKYFINDNRCSAEFTPRKINIFHIISKYIGFEWFGKKLNLEIVVSDGAEDKNDHFHYKVLVVLGQISYYNTQHQFGV